MLGGMEMRKWLKDFRLNKNLTQKELADMVGIHISMINKIELGNRTPSVKTAKDIAKILDFDWTLFFENCKRQIV